MLHETRKKLGLVGVSLVAGAALTLIVQSGFSFDRSAGATEAAEIRPPETWTIKGLNAMELEELGAIDWANVASGGEYNSETAIFEGDNIVVVWESAPAKLILDTPATYDEFVFVLEGKLILSDNNGNSATYGPGDMFMVPKGFTGTWEMTEEYRELIVVDTTAYNEE